MHRTLLKVLHEVGAVGVMGSLAACIAMIAKVPAHSAVELAALHRGVDAVTKWVYLPSLVIVLTSGLLSIAAVRAYQNAGWAWLKALVGISMFEGSLLTVVASSRHAAELSALAVAGPGDPVALAQALRTQWGGLWVMFALSLANIVLGVWRPRLGRTRPSD